MRLRFVNVYHIHGHRILKCLSLVKYDVRAAGPSDIVKLPLPVSNGSLSIKTVFPALVPPLGYDDLEIGNGLVASLAYWELRDPSTLRDWSAELRANLLAYCRRDTEAMLEMFMALR